MAGKLSLLCIFACCLFAVSVSVDAQPELPLPYYLDERQLLQPPLPRPLLVRRARSPLPEGGSIDLSVRKDQAGREASVQYNHNLFTSGDGRGSIDAYAHAQRNFDHNRNNFGGGIQGRWRF